MGNGGRFRRFHGCVMVAAFQKLQSHFVMRGINVCQLASHNPNQVFDKNTLLRRSYSTSTFHRTAQLQPELSVDLINIMEQKLSVIENRHAYLQAIVNQMDALPEEYSAANKELKKLRHTIDVVTELRKKHKKYSQKKGWKFDVLDVAESDLKGYKEACAAISGADVYGKLKFESGIHRVQRVPVTEKAGRVHTSAVSVVILPQADQVDVHLRNEDLKIDTFRSGGSGGQHANTTNSAVRVTHVPTGLTVAIQDERSQHQNKAKALKVLCAKLYEMERSRADASRSRLRAEQIGSGDRSERIRTYNFPQGRVTDHRVGITSHSIDGVMQGENLDTFVDALLLQQEMDAIASLTSKQ
ncbi:hypothetical protein DH2020_001422 [Rehmannia glutinosa]|uniref:Peptide chain release factor domain-containing protein n=1 Tax=Rehmannia glutinosa TaxID=99300 RepID=A0ABR0XZR6_REHGL